MDNNNNAQNKIKINLDPILYSLTNVNIGFNEEVFDFLMITGNQGKRFRATPKHAKRIYLLLEKSIQEYEKKFGEIKTQLAQAGENTAKEEIGFNQE